MQLQHGNSGSPRPGLLPLDGTMRPTCCATSVFLARPGCLTMWEGTGTSSLFLTLSCLCSLLGFIQLAAVLSETQNELKLNTLMAKTESNISNPDGIITGEYSAIERNTLAIVPFSHIFNYMAISHLFGY